MPSNNSPSSNAQHQFYYLVTRLVLQDATRQIAWGVGILVMLQSFIVKWVPPWIMRDAIQTSSTLSRTIFSLVILFLYAIVTRPLLGLLLGSRRLHFLKHLPVHPNQWMKLHLWHLLAINTPWFGLSWYAILTGKAGMEIGKGILWWLAWCLLTLSLQLAIYFMANKQRFLLLLVPLALFPALRFPSILGGILISFTAVFSLPFWLKQPIPQESRKVKGWWFKKKTPVWLWLRIEWLTLWREGMQALSVRLASQIICLGGLALAISNNGFKDPFVLFKVSIGVLIPCTLLAASSAIVVQQKRSIYAWWDNHLGITSLQLFWARWFLAFLGILPLSTMVWIGIEMGGGHLAWNWFLLITLATLSIGTWAASLCAYLGWKMQSEKKLHEGIFWLLLVHGFPVLIVQIFFPQSTWLLPFLAYWYGRKGLERLQIIRKRDSVVPPPRALGYEHN